MRITHLVTQSLPACSLRPSRIASPLLAFALASSMSACGVRASDAAPATVTSVRTVSVGAAAVTPTPPVSSSPPVSAQVYGPGESGPSERLFVSRYTPPAEATRRTADGAAAFARFYWATLGQALFRGEVGMTTQYYEASCTFCVELEMSAVSLASSGRHVENSNVQLTGVRVDGSPSAPSVRVSYRLTEDGSRVVMPSGEATATPGLDRDDVMTLNWTPRGWMITDITVLRRR